METHEQTRSNIIIQRTYNSHTTTTSCPGREEPDELPEPGKELEVIPVTHEVEVPCFASWQPKWQEMARIGKAFWEPVISLRSVMSDSVTVRFCKVVNDPQMTACLLVSMDVF